MKSIKKALRKLGEIFNRVLDALLEQLKGREPEPEMIPVRVRKDRN